MRKAGKECEDFEQVHDLIERAEALELEDLNPATTCRLRLALEALELAQRAGGACKAGDGQFSSEFGRSSSKSLTFPSFLVGFKPSGATGAGGRLVQVGQRP